jgi:hypothetical protein
MSRWTARTAPLCAHLLLRMRSLTPSTVVGMVRVQCCGSSFSKAAMDGELFVGSRQYMWRSRRGGEQSKGAWMSDALPHTAECQPRTPRRGRGRRRPMPLQSWCECALEERCAETRTAVAVLEVPQQRQHCSRVSIGAQIWHPHAGSPPPGRSALAHSAMAPSKSRVQCQACAR